MATCPASLTQSGLSPSPTRVQTEGRTWESSGWPRTCVTAEDGVISTGAYLSSRLSGHYSRKPKLKCSKSWTQARQPHHGQSWHRAQSATHSWSWSWIPEARAALASGGLLLSREGEHEPAYQRGERRKEGRREGCAQRWRGRWPGAHKAEPPSAFLEGSSFPSLALQPPPPPDPPRSPGWDSGPVSCLEPQG